MTTAMRSIITAMAIGLATLLPATAQAQETREPVAIAAAVLDHMEAGDFDTATVDFNDTLKAQIGSVQLASVQLQLESAGAVKSRGDAQVSERDGFIVVVYRIDREQAALNATIAIDGSGKVAGLHFAPADAGAQ